MAKKNKKVKDDRFQPVTATIVCDELVEFCCKYMALGLRKYELKKRMEDELGIPMSPRTYETLRAQAIVMMKEILLTPEQHKCNALEIIYQTVQDGQCPPASRLRAAELLLNASASVSSEEADERTEHIKSILKGIEESVSGDGDAEDE